MRKDTTYIITIKEVMLPNNMIGVIPDTVEHVGITKDEFVWALAQTTDGRVDGDMVVYSDPAYYDGIRRYVYTTNALNGFIPPILERRLEALSSLHPMVIHSVEYEDEKRLYLIPYENEVGAHPLCVIKKEEAQ